MTKLHECSKDLIMAEQKFGAFNYDPLPVVLTKGKDEWVWDVEGNKYFDCLSSYSALNFGHCNERITEVAIQQIKKLTLTGRAFYNDKLGEFFKEITALTGMESALPMNTGAEAVETGIKLARRWGYRNKLIPKDCAEIIVCKDNFHGRTTTIVGFSSDEDTRSDFGPATPGFKIIPFNDPDALLESITKNTAAFLVEPVQGEAGIIIPSEGYLKEIRKICTDLNVLLILDEIQTGFGRTGKNFAYQHENIMPDILLVGKALGGGVVPISATLASRSLMDLFNPGSHGSTFGGNPLACAIALEVISMVKDGSIAEKAKQKGEMFLKLLKTNQSDKIKEYRGKGLMIAAEFNDGLDARDYCEKFLKAGILAKESHKNKVRLTPPLITKDETLKWAAKVIADNTL